MSSALELEEKIKMNIHHRHNELITVPFQL